LQTLIDLIDGKLAEIAWCKGFMHIVLQQHLRHLVATI